LQFDNYVATGQDLVFKVFAVVDLFI